MVDKMTGILHVRRWGEITTQDKEAALGKRKEDSLIVPNIAVVVDCREVDPSDSTGVIQYIADRIMVIASDVDCGQVAIVVSSDVESGMARMYMAYTELKHPHTEVFRSYDNALKWLQENIEKPFPNTTASYIRPEQKE